MSDLLRIKNITSGYQGKAVIDNISFGVKAGTITALLGANGAGKSTLMKSIAGLVKPFSGRIEFEGQDITDKDARTVVKMGVSYVPEGRAMARQLSVGENLQLGGLVRDTATRKRQFDLVMDLFPEISTRLESPAWQLSGGQQQMLAIGRALMGNPRLLMLDEPSLGLAPLLIKRVFEQLVKLRDAGITMLVVEQNYWITAQVADSAWFIRNGRLVGNKSGEEMRTRESLDEVVKTYLGAKS